MRYVATIAALTLVYALALASFHPWDLLLGAILSTTLLTAFRWSRVSGPGGGLSEPNGHGGSPLGRLLAFFPFAVAVAREVLSGAWRVLLATVGLKRPQSPGIVAVPLGERSPSGISISAFLAAFTPGTLLVDVDERKGEMLIHAMDAADPEAVRESQEKLYQRYQKKVFP